MAAPKDPDPCGCCPYCGALPGHQNPPTEEVWQHKHSPVREKMAESRPLSERQIQIVTLISEGKTNKEIAAELVLSQHTIKSHLTRIASVLGTGDRAGMVAIAFRKGMIT